QRHVGGVVACLEDGVLFLEIEHRPRRDRDHQLAFERHGHGLPSGTDPERRRAGAGSAHASAHRTRTVLMRTVHYLRPPPMRESFRVSQRQSAPPGRRSNRLFAEIALGDSASSRRACTEHSLYLFAQASRTVNPLHIPEREARIDADGDPLTGASASALWIGALASELVGSRLPGPGATLRAQSLVFHQRVYAGTVVQTELKVIEKLDPDLIVLDARFSDDTGGLVASGQIQVFAPPHRIEFDDEPLGEVIIDHHPHFERIVAACAGVAPTRVAVICPEDEVSLD